MNPKVPYIPILVVLGPKLWAVSLKLHQPEQLNMPLFDEMEITMNGPNLVKPDGAIEKAIQGYWRLKR